MNDFQRTDEWYLSRKNKITASEIEKILHRGRKKDEAFAATAISYLNEKVAEYFMGDDDFVMYMRDIKRSNAAMQWGTEYESMAREQYELATGSKVMDAPFTVLEGFEEFAGGSPDGRLSTLDGIVEYKCPYNPAIHIEHCKWTKPEDLLIGNPTYYAQVQMNMLITHTNYCDFVSYSPLYRHGMDLSVLRVPTDEEYQKLLLGRIAEAVEYINTQINLIKSIEK